MYDMVIRQGFVIDGTGSPRRQADVAIAQGRVIDIAPEVDGRGREEIDAEGLLVAPGIVDIHTHYDAQLTWDPAATPSVFHGVTTVIGGNCGFSIAPLGPDSADYLVPMLATVEGIPEETLRTGLDIAWQSFAEYLSALNESLVVNAGFMVGHSALRHAVMGSKAVGGEASSEQVDEMVQLLHSSIDAGALGFSTSRGELHVDHNGDPVPSRAATLAEILALCKAAGTHPGTSIETIPPVDQLFDERTHLMMTAMSLAARRPVNWNVITLESNETERASRLLASDVAAAAGGTVVALSQCHLSTPRYSLERPFLWETLQNWDEVMHLPLPERVEAFKSPSVRARLRAGAESQTRRWVDWPNYTVHDVSSPALRPLVGRNIGELAADREQEPFDVFCDIAVEDELRSGFCPRPTGSGDEGWRSVVELCSDPRIVVGASDAGAHVDMISHFGMYTAFLGQAARVRQVVSMEEAISLLTAKPARLYGLTGRGTLQVGSHGDVMIFDPDTIDNGALEVRRDLPGGAERRYSEPIGVRAVIVSGEIVVDSGQLTGASPGRALRSGHDSETPAMACGTGVRGGVSG